MAEEAKKPKKLLALIAEDDQVSLELLTSILESTKIIECIPAVTGKEAIEIYKSNKINITFLDIDMPCPNGIETLKIIKDLNKNAKVVMVTATRESATVKLAITNGAVNYIVKPFEPEKIISILKNFNKN